jgi:hypothetical protein
MPVQWVAADQPTIAPAKTGGATGAQVRLRHLKGFADVLFDIVNSRPCGVPSLRLIRAGHWKGARHAVGCGRH